MTRLSSTVSASNLSVKDCRQKHRHTVDWTDGVPAAFSFIGPVPSHPAQRIEECLICACKTDFVLETARIGGVRFPYDTDIPIPNRP